MYNYQDYLESADKLKQKLNGFEPQVLLILGSGLGKLAELIHDPIYVPYSELPHFQVSTAIGHAGRFAAGTLSGKRVLIMQGRLHMYEGYTPQQVTFPVRVAKLIGIDTLVITNAAGGINTDFKVGDIIILKDFIRLSFPDPLMGPNIEEFGPRFPDMSFVFDREFRSIFRAIMESNNDPPKEGVYFYASGPQYETPAEIRAMRLLGGDVVGMSTVPECIVARHAGMRILGLSLVSNMAAGVLEQPLSGEEVIAAGEAAFGRFSKYVLEFLGRI